MCTVSWAATPDGYELFCNRDERRTRKAAHAPTLRTSRGVRFVAPTDAEAGGTWIAANEYGLTLCLLNRYADTELEAARDFKSRGLLIPGLMNLRDPAGVMRAVAREGLVQFRPFTLLAISPCAPPAVASWTGQRLLVAEDDADSLMPLTSSSFMNAEVTRRRKELFRSMAAGSARLTPDLLMRYQRSHAPECGPFSVCMQRDEASTVSFSRVKVSPRAVEFYYQPEPPCVCARGDSVSFARAADGKARWREAARWNRSREAVV